MASIPKIGFWAGLSLVIGNIIGVGIFTTTGYMTQYIQSPILILTAWLVGGIYAISGAVVYGTLSEQYPSSGGDYVYLSKSMHPVLGYMFGWSAFFVTYSGSIAALAIAAAIYFKSALMLTLAEYHLIVFGYVIDIPFSKVFAIGLVLILSWINYRGIVVSGKYQFIFSCLIVLFMIAFALSGTVSDSQFPMLGGEIAHRQTVSDYLTSLIAVLFAYMGWTTAVYVAEEVREAPRLLPRILLIGVTIVTILYVWINIVFLNLVPVPEMNNVVNIGSLAAQKIFGESGQVVISALIFFAILGSLNSTILSGPRIYMAMGRDGFFLGKTEKRDTTTGTPYIALWLQLAWSLLLILSGSFNDLLSYVVFIAILFSLLAAVIAIKFILNLKKGILRLIPAGFYLLFCLIILINTAWQQPWQSLIGLSLTMLAWPFYVFERKRKKRA